MTIQSLEYKVYGQPIENKSVTSNNDGTLTITGIASTTNKDYANEIVSQEVLESLAKQAVGINLYLDHNKRYEGGIGVVTDAWIKDNQLWVEAKILSQYAPEIKERIDIGMNFGFSIGGFPKKTRVPEGLLITDYDLKDITLTYIPMNWETYGTVEYKSQNLITSNCLTGACYHAIKNSGEIMTDEIKTENIEEPVQEETKSNNDGAGLNDVQLNQVRDLINEANAELEPRILDTLRGELSGLADDAANKAAETVAERILAEFKATQEVKTADEIPEEDNKSETTEEETVEEDNKSEPGISEPENEEELETKDLEDSDDESEEEEIKDESESEELEEKSLPQMVHDEIVKQMNTKSLSSKFDKFMKSKSTSMKMDEKSQKPKVRRDMYGRNLDYI